MRRFLVNGIPHLNENIAIVVRSCQQVAEEPEIECASKEEISSKVEKVSVDFAYRFFYFDSNTFG